jgi:hypothetical protein
MPAITSGHTFRPLSAITWSDANANRQPDFLAVVVVCNTEEQTHKDR